MDMSIEYRAFANDMKRIKFISRQSVMCSVHFEEMHVVGRVYVWLRGSDKHHDMTQHAFAEVIHQKRLNTTTTKARRTF